MTDHHPSPHPSSWYAESSPLTPYPALQDDRTADVCVLGGGIAGCSAALHLAERGYRVILLEGQAIGSGASGRSGGQCLPGFSCGQGALERAIGAGPARLAWDMTLEGLQLQRELIARHHIDCDWRAGHLQVCLHARHERELREEMDDLRNRYGYSGLEWIAADRLHQHVGSARYVGGLLDTHAAHLHPLKYTQGVARAAAAAGAEIFERSRVQQRIAVSATAGSPGHPPRWRLITDRGSVSAHHVLLAGNATLGALEPTLQTKIMGVGTYMIATEPLGAALTTKLLPTDLAVSDLNWILDYFRLSADHRLLFGGGVSYSGLHGTALGETLRRRMLRVFPELAGAAITHRWGGWLDITRNRAPHFGRLEPNVYFVQGFSGHGLVLAGLAGRLLAEVIQGQSERFDVFTRIAHQRFPGGPWLRRPALVLAMLWYRLRDWL